MLTYISFNLGGEKLKLSRAFLGAFFVLLFIIPQISGISNLLYAQETAEPLMPESAAGPERRGSLPDESTIILGETPEVPAPESTSSVFVLIRMVLVLALAALAIYGVVFFVKRLARPRESTDPNLKVLAKVPLSNDSFAAVISVGAKAWLVAGGGGSINLISEIDETEALETMLIEDARKSAEKTSRLFPDFRSLLSRFGASQAGKTAQGPSGDGENSVAENLRKQRDRLKRL